MGIVVIELNEQERDVFRKRSAPVRKRFLETVGDRGRPILSELLAALARAQEARDESQAGD